MRRWSCLLRRHRGVRAGSRPAPSKAPSPTRPRRPSRAPASSARNLDTGFTRETDVGARRLLPPAAAAGRPLHADRRSAAVRDAGAGADPGQRQPDACASTSQLELPTVTETVTVAGERAARRHVDQRARPRRHRPRARRSAAQRPQLHAARPAADRRRAAHRRRRHRGRQPAPGQAYAVNGMRPEQNIYLVDGAQNMNRMDGGYALKLPGRRDRRVPHPHAERAAGVRRHRRRHHERRHALGQQPVPRQPLRVRPQRRLRRAQLLLREGRAAQAEPVRRHARRPDRARPRRSSSATTRASATSRASRRRRTVPTAAERQGDFSGMGTPLHQLRRRRRADSRATRSRQAAINPVALQRARPVPARQRLAVASTARRWSARTTSTRPAAASTSTRRRTTSSSRATRTRAATTSTRSRCAAPTCRASRRATTSRRTPPRCRTPASCRRR